MAEKVLHDYPQVFKSLTLLPSSGGLFEVTLDGELIFSKQEQGRFPEDEEISASVEAFQAG